MSAEEDLAIPGRGHPVRTFLSLVGVMASLVMLAVSGSMNFYFMKSLGKTEIEGLILGGASASADVLKALLPFFIWWAWENKRRIPAVVGSVVFAFFTMFSLISALGFAAENRGNVANTREALNASFDSARQELGGIEERLKALPPHRPAQVVTQAIEGTKQNRRWTTTKGCEDATASASRTFCEEYFALKAELESAIVAKRLQDRMATLRAEVGRLRDSGAGQDSDPQVSVLSRLFGHEEDRVRLALIVFAALLVEIGSGLGLFLSTGHVPRAVPATPAPASSTARRRPEGDMGMKTGDVARVPTARGVAAIAHVEEPEVREMGSFEDYVVARLQPSSDGGLTLAQLYEDYQGWCHRRDLEAMGQVAFGRSMEALASDLPIPKEGAVYLWISLGNAADDVAGDAA